jgi:protein-tyrosine phosphatase
MAFACSAAIAAVISSGCHGASEHGSVQEADASFQLPRRHIELDGQSNFRDLGGYKTADGRTVKWGQVYRSGELPRLSDADVQQLDRMEIQTVVSFLTEAEIADRGPDRLPWDTREVALPMEAGNLGDLTEVVSEARRSGDFSQVPPEINPDIHRRLMVEGREYYAALLREIAHSTNQPLVFHCSHGIHRTGTASAILLSALGVPWETVREDYLLSNSCRQEEIGVRLKQLKRLAAENQGISEDQVDTANMEAFYILDGSYVDAALDQAVKDYGSMDAYIREGLGLSDDEIEQLRSELLED